MGCNFFNPIFDSYPLHHLWDYQLRCYHKLVCIKDSLPISVEGQPPQVHCVFCNKYNMTPVHLKSTRIKLKGSQVVPNKCQSVLTRKSVKEYETTVGKNSFCKKLKWISLGTKKNQKYYIRNVFFFILNFTQGSRDTKGRGLLIWIFFRILCW